MMSIAATHRRSTALFGDLETNSFPLQQTAALELNAALDMLFFSQQQGHNGLQAPFYVNIL